VGALHALVAAHAQDPAQVVVGIETDRGLLVGVLLAAGYQVYAVNPQVVSRYRGRHGSSRAKSDRGDAKVLADLVRTDRHNTVKWLVTVRWWRRSRCWPGPIRA
jgi:transposase